MKNGVIKQFLLLSFLSISQIAFAQNATESDGNLMLLGILIAVVVIAFFLIIQVADNLLSIEAKNSGLDTTKHKSIYPSNLLVEFIINHHCRIHCCWIGIVTDGNRKPTIDEIAVVVASFRRNWISLARVS